MKYFLVFFVAVFGAGCARNDLTNDIMEFVDLLPMEKIDEILQKYMAIEEFKTVYMYATNSEEFKQIILGMEKIPEFLELLKYLDGSGVEVYEYLRLLHDALGLPPPELLSTSSYKTNAARARNIMHQYVDELRSVLPENEITKLHDLKMAKSPAFQYFAQRLESQELEVIVKNLKYNTNYQDYMKTLMDNGLDMVDNIHFAFQIIGFRQISFLNLIKSS